MIEEARGSATIVLRSELPAQPGRATRAAMSRAWPNSPRPPTSSGCPTSILHTSTAHDYAERAGAMLAAGASLVIITRGVAGPRPGTSGAGAIEVETPQVEVVDTIGAGDSFQAALLFALHAMGRIAARPLTQIERGRTSPRAVFRGHLRGHHLRARRRRSAAWRGCRRQAVRVIGRPPVGALFSRKRL